MSIPPNSAALRRAGRRCAVCRAGAHAAIPIQHWTQPSGAKVYLVESPRACRSSTCRSTSTPAAGATRRDKAGLAGVTAGMIEKGMRASGGEPALDENALGEAWADLGASFGAGAGADRMSFSLRSLSDPDAARTRRCAWPRARSASRPFRKTSGSASASASTPSIREANTKPATIAGRAFCAGGLRRPSLRLGHDRGDAGADRRRRTCAQRYAR